MRGRPRLTLGAVLFDILKVMIKPLCNVSVNLQNRWYVGPPLEPFGVTNDAWTINSEAFGMPQRERVTLREFVNMTEEDVMTNWMFPYLRTKGKELDLNTDKLIVIDIEGIVHPNNWGNLLHDDTNLGNKDGVFFEDIITALKMRVNLARKLLPNATFSYYGVVQPNTNGYYEKNFKKRLKGCQRAGELGMYDNVSYLSPWLPIMHSKDSGNPGYLLRAASARQAIEATQALTKSNGQPLKVIPISTFIVVGNTHDIHYQEPAHTHAPEAVQDQIKAFEDYESIKMVLYWIGNNPENYAEVIQDFFKTIQVVPLQCLSSEIG